MLSVRRRLDLDGVRDTSFFRDLFFFFDFFLAFFLASSFALVFALILAFVVVLSADDVSGEYATPAAIASARRSRDILQTLAGRLARGTWNFARRARDERHAARRPPAGSVI